MTKGVSGSARSFRAHLFLLDQQLVITHQQNKHKTFQHIDDIAVSDCRVICIGGWLCAHTHTHTGAHTCIYKSVDVYPSPLSLSFIKRTCVTYVHLLPYCALPPSPPCIPPLRASLPFPASLPFLPPSTCSYQGLSCWIVLETSRPVYLSATTMRMVHWTSTTAWSSPVATCETSGRGHSRVH